MGSGGVFKTPTLVGLASRAPYMHDGCAATLDDRFDDAACGGTTHGHPDVLTAGELAALKHYLASL